MLAAIATAAGAAAGELPVTGMRRVIGIVEVPSLFGVPDPDGPPGARLPADRAPVSLHRQPDMGSPIIATAIVPDDITTAEYAYETSGALVYREQGGWYLIGVHGDSGAIEGWLRPTDADRFHALPELLQQGLSYLTSTWDGELWPEPAGGRATPVPGTATHIKVLDTRTIGDRIWLRVDVLRPGHCEGATPKTLARGWIPAHSQAGKMNAWFRSRGC